MSFCANCGRPRDGDARFCGGCGTEFSDTADDQAPATADPTRTDMPAGTTRAADPDARPDPFASWYQPQPPPAAGGPPDAPGEQWQPTQTVGAAPARPAGYQPGPPSPAVPPYQPGQPYQPGAPYQPPRGPERGGRRGLFIAVAVIVVLAAGGGAYALASSLGKHSTAQPTATPSAGTSTQPASTVGTPSASASSGATPTPSPALSLVSIAPGVSTSTAAGVQTPLSHYFHGINSHDYNEYAGTLSPAERARQSQSTFESGYSTTADSGMTLTSLASSGTGLTATVTFTSHQAAADSVDHSTCNDWTLNLYLVPAGTGYLIGPAPAGYQPDHSDC
jgi:hypothetical protein